MMTIDLGRIRRMFAHPDGELALVADMGPGLPRLSLIEEASAHQRGTPGCVTLIVLGDPAVVQTGYATPHADSGGLRRLRVEEG